jgi:hypothetical protein
VIRKRINYIVSAFVLVIFTLYLVPHEAVHVFYDHHDTEHTDNHNGEAQFSSVHIHCDFLNTDLTDFLPSESPYRTEIITEVRVHYAEISTQCIPSVQALRESRGPPVVG